MVNRIGAEHPSPSRLPIRLVGSALLLGTLLAWWGTRDDRRLFGESPREPIATGGVVLPQVTQQESALLERGSQISQLQCAGCHEMTTRTSAPSYQEIVTFYRRESPASAGNRASAGARDLRSRLASAVTHPRPGWGNFAPGPSESGLSLDDRVAVASWILKSFDRGRNADEVAGK